MFFRNIYGIFENKLPYLDPGSGSIILQIVLAALLGAGAIVGIYWKKVKSFLMGKKQDQTQSEDTENDE